MYYVKSQISGETIDQTASPQKAKELANKEGHIRWGKPETDYPRAYVVDEESKVVYARYPNRPEYDVDLLG